MASGLPATTPADELVTRMVGRELEQLFPERPPAAADVVLEVRGVRRLPDVKEATFELRAGEVLGIAGLVGAGRSELLRAIYGVDRRDAGEVVVDGGPLPPGRPDRGDRGRARAGPRGPQVAGPAARVGPHQERHPGRPRPVPARPDPACGPSGRRRRRSSRALHTTPSDGSRLARELSGGNQQKVVLARWLLRQCRVLLLDEPTRGVDVGDKAELFRIIADLAERGARRDRRVVGDRGAVRAVHADPRDARGRAGRRARRRRRRPSSTCCATPCRAPSRWSTAARAGIRRDEATRRADGRPARPTPRRPRAGGTRRGPADRRCGSRSTRWSASSWCCWSSARSSSPTRSRRPTTSEPILTQASVVGVLAIGMTFVIATAGIDLSVGSIVAAAGVAGGLLIDTAGRGRSSSARSASGCCSARSTRRHRLRQGRALHRHAGHAGHRPRPGAADERQAPDQPARRPTGPLVRHRGDRRPAGVDLDLPGRDRRRVGAAQPHALRPPRRVGRRQPGGGAHRRRARAPDGLQRLLPLAACSPASPRSCCAAGWPAPRRCRASCSSSTRSAPP